MATLVRLKEKIEQLKKDYKAMKSQNANLKSQIAGIAKAEKSKDYLLTEVEEKTRECKTYEQTIAMLKYELEEKDAEIEKIIAQVESLLA